MLYSIDIQNFAIVKAVQLQFEPGFSIVTGETGAGKSIVIDALSLVLGARADSSVVRHFCDFTQITAQFYPDAASTAWLVQQEFDNADKITLKRIIYTNGRSKAFINQQLVALQTLRELGDLLVDIHGQHAHQSLLKAEIQRAILDHLAANNHILQQVQNSYHIWQKQQSELSKLGGQGADRAARLELLRYQVQELEALDLTPDKVQNIEHEHQRLAHANQLLENASLSLNLLDGEEANSLAIMNQASQLLNAVQQFDHQLLAVQDLLAEARIQVQEAVLSLRQYLERLEVDPQRLQEVEDYIGSLQTMARKHKVSYHELPQHFAKLLAQLQQLEADEQRASILEQQVQISWQEYQLAAQALHQQRLAIAQDLAAKITDNMQQLGMAGGKLIITVNMHNRASAQGMDEVSFLVSTNPGHAPKPLHKVASGGELSRISLAIQVITAQRTGVPTLIFDEVDVGISGGVAEVVGKLLRNLGQQRQVLCVTHLPQVASLGHRHLQVVKTIAEHSTHIQLRWLSHQQRIEELARILGGVEMTAQTLAHAEEMLARAMETNP